MVGEYLDSALTPKGQGRHRFLRELFALSREVSASLFTTAIARALKYRIEEIGTIRRIVLMHLSGGMDALPWAEVDESFVDREAYMEGRLTDEPDFSRYDDLLEDHDG